LSAERFRRKLRAILSADVKGYSRLMGEDEDSTIRTLGNYQQVMAELIEQYRGRVVDAIGDNLLAEFASAADAVQCAVEIQEELRARNSVLLVNHRMEFRIGVNLGDVIEEGDRIYGDGINIAARIEALADAGGVSISGTVYDSVAGKLGLKYEYSGEQTVKNINKPIRVYKVVLSRVPPGQAVVAPKERIRRSWLKTALILSAVLVLGLGAVAIWRFYLHPSSSETKPALPDKPSIAVLPFVNMSADPQQEYFSDGLTEDIITGLSKIPRLFVIARNSSFTYKGKSVKVQQVGRDLGVRYVLEGSVRKAGERVRITAQLIDAGTGHHLWAERYDRDLKDIFALQDEITEQILTAMEVNLTTGEQARLRRKGTANRKAYEKVLKADEYYGRMTREDNAQARQAYKEAMALDPEYAVPVVGLSYTHWMDVINGWSRSPRKSMKEAAKLAQKALELDDSLADTHVLLGNIYLMKGQYQQAMDAGERALTLEPNGADVNALLGLMLRYLGRPEEAISVLEKAIRLNPIPPAWYLYNIGDAYRLAGLHDKAIESFKKALKQNPDHFLYKVYLAATYGETGQKEEGQRVADEVIRINPKFSVELYAKRLPYRNRDDIRQIIEGLHNAGLE
jgi:adenylate cyclase